MALIRFTDQPFFRNPWNDYDQLRKKMDFLLKGMDRDVSGYASANVFPSLNISENENNLYVRAEIPGVDVDDLDISIEEDTLVIKGERKAETVAEEASFHRREIQRGKFSRAITLPTRINRDTVEATTENGLLTIVLPKAEDVKPRQISVKSA